ncbi:selenide, water dikinase SelD [Aestuariibius insulae]|uniref:selenide, water dikinase SelD n=1 Tax=Aestuariibius insulae TaxID=2058287 RepID=UPI00345E5916
MIATTPLSRELILIGGGHTHALVLRKWGMNPLPGARVTLINPGPTAPYTGMLPGFVAGHYTRDELDIDLVRLARFAGARLILGKASAIDPDARTVTVKDRVLPFDVLSVDIGITSDMPDLPGFAEHGIPAKPLGRFASAWEVYRDGGNPAGFAVIGGGVAGVELAMAMHHALRERGRDVQATVIDAGQALSGTGSRARSKLLSYLEARDIALIEDTEVEEITDTAVRLTNGQQIPSTFTTGAAGARPYGWLAETGLNLTDGYLTVNRYLETAHDGIFAVGDCAHLSHAPRPKAGVFAVREAPILFDNLVARLSEGTLTPYKPQSDYLKLISLGEKSALAERSGLAPSGKALWRLKDKIDRDFMAKFIDLEPMRIDPPKRAATDAIPDAPLCGGCGAKVGQGALTSALSGTPGPDRSDITRLPGDDAALLTMGWTRQVITTDHLRAVTEDPHRMARIAAIHALGDIWAMGAAPQAALATLILPRMTDKLQKAWLSEIMEAAGEVFAAEGAEIVGGHTTLGSELTIGFTITGLLDGPPITLAGAKPGDALILTKPIGSGVLLAAEMQLAAKGTDIAALLDAMAQSQGQAAALLRKAHAMTDVTGFGLAGHCLNICEASGLAAEIELAAIPVYDGAQALAGQGVQSVLMPTNRADAASRITVPDDPRTALLFDPQTAGGLLAACPAKTADKTLANLHSAGFDAAIVGQCIEGAPHLTVR